MQRAPAERLRFLYEQLLDDIAACVRSTGAVTTTLPSPEITHMKTPLLTSRLIQELGDRDKDVRWLASEGLIRLGRDGLVPLLRKLTKSDAVSHLPSEVRHVIHALACQKDLRDILKPVLQALSGVNPTVRVPFAAAVALRALEGGAPCSSGRGTKSRSRRKDLGGRGGSGSGT